MSSPTTDTLTRSVWLDRIIMAAFVSVFGVFFVRNALGGRFGGGTDWQLLGYSFISAAFWAALIRGVLVVV